MFWLRLAFFVLLLPFIALGILWMMWGRGLPAITTLDALEYSGTTRVYDINGRLFTTLAPAGGRRGGQLKMLNLNQMGWAAKAVMESEDRRFYEHGGVDFIGITRGLLKGIFKNDLEGGSSITQQVVKNTLLSNLNSARTLERKFKEALLASRLERKYSKQDILRVYMNVVYWGNGGGSDIVGINDAAQAYFRKDASQLNLAESAYLATIIPAPNKRYKDFVGYRPLVKSLLERMVDDGQITQAQAQQAWNTPIYPSGWRIDWGEGGKVNAATFADATSLARHAPQNDSASSYYYLQGLQQQLGQLGQANTFTGGKVYSTLDPQAQDASERASLNVGRMPRGATLGIALLDPQNGEVRALVGQRLFYNQAPNEWNNAIQAKRQVGSSIKPLLYTLALSKGWKQSDRVLDSPIDDKDYQPKNYDGTWLGVPVTLRYALDHSLNLPTVRLAKEVGLDNFRAKLRDLGMNPAGDLGLSLAIGTLEASPLQMAAAYAPFANGGTYHTPSFVRRIEDENGKALYQRPQSELAGKQVWDAQTAWLGLDMLRGVVNDLDSDQGGLATRARIDGWEVGGKTGTTNDIKDLWFVGTTSRLTGAVWVGKQAGGSLPQWAYSGTIPAPIWQQAMSGALRGQKPVAFREPGGIEYAVVRRVKMAFRAAPAAPTPIAQQEAPARSWWPFGRRKTETPPADTQTAPASTSSQETVTPSTTAPNTTTPNTTAPSNNPTSVTLQPATPPESQPDTAQPNTVQPNTAQPQTTPTSTTPTTTTPPQQSAPADTQNGGAPQVQFQGNQGDIEVAPATR